MCLAILTRIGRDGNLLKPYQKDAGEAEGKLVLDIYLAGANQGTDPFKPTGDLETMWDTVEFTPSRAFDAAFTKAYWEKTPVPLDRLDMANIRIRTAQCLEQKQSNPVCSATGKIQGAYAYLQLAK